MKLKTFKGYLEKKMRNPKFKRGFEAFGIAIEIMRPYEKKLSEKDWNNLLDSIQAALVKRKNL